MTEAPYASIWVRFGPEADSGMNILLFIPARAVYAAKEAPALPEESSIACLTDLVTKKLTRTALPRSLNDPVGLDDSTLKATG